MAMAYSLAYLVVGLAIALWGVIVPTVRCRSADFRSTVLFVYVFIAAVYHRYSVSNDPYVALGLVVIAVSWGYVYLRNHLNWSGLGIRCVISSVGRLECLTLYSPCE